MTNPTGPDRQFHATRMRLPLLLARQTRRERESSLALDNNGECPSLETDARYTFRFDDLRRGRKLVSRKNEISAVRDGPRRSCEEFKTNSERPLLGLFP